MAVFSEEKISRTSKWIEFYREDWEGDIPLKIHAYGVDDGHGLGGPPFSREFEEWLGQLCFCGRKPDPSDPNDRGCPSESTKGRRPFQSPSRLRTTRAFRKLRKVAPREFDALYMMCALRVSFEETMRALNDRAERLGKPERYSPEDVLLLIVSGVDKVNHYW